MAGFIGMYTEASSTRSPCDLGLDLLAVGWSMDERGTEAGWEDSDDRQRI